MDLISEFTQKGSILFKIIQTYYEKNSKSLYLSFNLCRYVFFIKATESKVHLATSYHDQKLIGRDVYCISTQGHVAVSTMAISFGRRENNLVVW